MANPFNLRVEWDLGITPVDCDEIQFTVTLAFGSNFSPPSESAPVQLLLDLQLLFLVVTVSDCERFLTPSTLRVGFLSAVPFAVVLRWRDDTFLPNSEVFMDLFSSFSDRFPKLINFHTPRIVLLFEANFFFQIACPESRRDLGTR
jgi:hypothetical protein